MATADRRPLSRDRILAAALVLVDQGGLEALSMRKLGAALGVEAMSLYNHVQNKDEVVDGVLELALREVEIPGPELDWTERIRTLARNFRRLGLAHPGVLPLLGTLPITSAEGFAPVAALYTMLVDGGFDEERAVEAFVLVATFIMGFLRLDQSLQAPRHGDPADTYTRWTGTQYEDAVRLGLHLISRDWDVEFDRCLDLVIEAMVALVDSQAVAGGQQEGGDAPSRPPPPSGRAQR